MNDKKMLALSGDLRQFHVGDTITISGPSSFVWWKPWTWKRQKPKQFKIKEVYVHENVVELE